MPPLVIAAVNVIEPDGQILLVDAVMLMVGVTAVDTVIVISFDVTGLTVAHDTFDVKMQVTTSFVARADEL